MPALVDTTVRLLGQEPLAGRLPTSEQIRIGAILGQAGFAWSFMGALGLRTSLRFGTGVTCPTFRYHPAVVAQAAATLGAMFPGRFWLGLGAGEQGGRIVFSGSLAGLMREPRSLTAKYLRQELAIPVPTTRRRGTGQKLRLLGATPSRPPAASSRPVSCTARAGPERRIS